MKRHGYLWDGMISFENLLQAAHAAARGKRFRPAVARFGFHLERELWRLHEELESKTYRPGPYRTFTIFEPKPRLISATPTATGSCTTPCATSWSRSTSGPSSSTATPAAPAMKAHKKMKHKKKM